MFENNLQHDDVRSAPILSSRPSADEDIMELNDSATRPAATGQNVYLIVQKGSARLSVIPLDPEQRYTVGRASSNRVVIPDAKCSRQHCELFHQQGQWLVRDLESRNGVTVDGRKIENDWSLRPGEVIAVGNCTLVFSHERPSDSSVAQIGGSMPFTIIDRKSGTQFDAPSGSHEPAASHDAAELFRLARRMNAATDINTLAQCVLDGLAAGTSATVVAVLLLPTDAPAPSADNLELVALLAPEDRPDVAVSDYLSRVVLAEREAVLAHDIAEQSHLAERKSLHELAADSAICAPIRHADAILGVIHLYSADSRAPLTTEQLEVTLAVADQMAGNLQALQTQARLAEDLSKVENHVRELNEQLEVETELVGTSPTLDKVRHAVARVARTDATVLIRGESGVGKELVARAVHFNSPRKDGPFVCVNCAALTESLLESELFGHEKGAFTGASGQKAGKFEQATDGTLFLDEIGEMSPEIQAKFLRVLEGQAFERVGGGKPITVDVRVVTATNRDLEEAVREGTFRADLYFRLQVIEVYVPALREHPQDIPEIAQHFLKRFARRSRPQVRGFTSEALQLLQQHSWPGNVRELRNVVERAVILSEHEWLRPEDISLTRLSVPDPAMARASAPTAENGSGEYGEGLETAVDPHVDLLGSYVQQEITLDELDRLYISAVLNHFNWNKSQAARTLGIERTTLDRRLKRYGMKRPE
ncbi:MAG: sigma 54-interacting transcriptional regulator [Maioricimonas sp. JB045]|uniref:sigma 54-interacting transcriptional regulator n=1 Tax=Maioricimonas sp. JC845 TaxID=3232138 RepID=UPI0034588C6B